MKTNFKKLFIDGTLIVAISTLMACSNQPSSENKSDTKDMAEESNDAKFSKAAEKDAQFVVDVVSMNYSAIKMSDLAQTNAYSADLKTFAKMVSDDHSKANRELMALASTKGISVPEAPTNDALGEYDNLKNETGKDFDKKYSSEILKAHKTAIDKFEKASTDCQDPDIRNWASNMLPGLRAHLDQAMAQDKMANQ